jgi:hypothetical protein
MNKNQGEKRKLNAVLGKEKYVGVQPFIAANKTKEN